MNNSETAQVRRVLYLALAVNLAVAALKIGYGKGLGWLGIEADGYHSLTDALVSLVALGSVALAMRPPDPRHPYGHRKLEIVAALFIGASLLLLSAEIASEVVTRLERATHARPRLGIGAFLVLSITLAANFMLSSYQARAGRRLRSAILLTDARHTRADCYTTMGVMLATLLGWLGHPELDTVAAGVVAVLVAKAGVEVVRDNIGYLLDVALVEPEEVARVVESIPPVAGVHRVRTRGTPSAIFMDLKLRLPRHLDLVAASETMALASEAIRGEFPSVVDVVIHAEPE